MQSRLIVNPVAGSDRGAELAGLLKKRLQRQFGELDLVTTAGEGDARRAAREAAQDRYDYLFVAGGDGTLNEALNGVLDEPNAAANVTFGIVPLGTGNDFATSLGIPDDIDQAIDVLARRQTRHIDVGCLNGASLSKFRQAASLPKCRRPSRLS